MVEPKANHSHLEAHANLADMRLNDLIIGTEIVIGVLQAFADTSEEWEEPFTIPLPSNNANVIAITRSRTQLYEIVTQQIRRKEYEKALIVAIAEAEDHISSYIRIVLKAYPERLTRGSKGGLSDRTVAWDDVIRHYSKESLVDSFIDDRINSVIRLRPVEHLEYLGHIIESHLPRSVIDAFSESCATRDLIVNAQGKIKDEYIAKARSLRRGKVGDVLVIDKQYFDASMSSIKNLYTAISDAMRAKYNEDQHIVGVFSKMGIMRAYQTLMLDLQNKERGGPTEKSS